eukprot:SAG31_NODE_57_length_29727_cov_12.584568_24_plen_59_part_00
MFKHLLKEVVELCCRPAGLPAFTLDGPKEPPALEDGSPVRYLGPNNVLVSACDAHARR